MEYNKIIIFSMWIGQGLGFGLKSVVDHQQSTKYCCQLPSRLCGQHAQQLLPRTYRQKVLCCPNYTNSAVQTQRTVACTKNICNGNLRSYVTLQF